MHNFDMNGDDRITIFDLLKWLWFEIRHGNFFVISFILFLVYYFGIPFYKQITTKQVKIEQNTKKLQEELDQLKDKMVNMQNRRYGVVGTTTF